MQAEAERHRTVLHTPAPPPTHTHHPCCRPLYTPVTAPTLLLYAEHDGFVLPQMYQAGGRRAEFEGPPREHSNLPVRVLGVPYRIVIL